MRIIGPIGIIIAICLIFYWWGQDHPNPAAVPAPAKNGNIEIVVKRAA